MRGEGRKTSKTGDIIIIVVEIIEDAVSSMIEANVSLIILWQDLWMLKWKCWRS